MIADNTTYKGRTLGQWVEMAQRNEAEIVRLAGELSEKVGAPDLRSAIPTWQERAGKRWSTEIEYLSDNCKILALLDEVDDLRAALASAAPVEALSCAWTPDADYEAEAWHSSCGEAWSFIDGGPKENCVRFCQGCGKPVAIQARAIEARIEGGAK